MKRKVIVNLINISHIVKFLDKDSKFKLVRGLVFSIIDFYKTLDCSLPNIIVKGPQILINSATRIIAGYPRFSRVRINPICISLQILQIKARIKYKVCLLTNKAIQCKELLYLNKVLELRESITINFWSNHDTWKRVEHRVPALVSLIDFSNIVQLSFIILC